MKNYGAGCSGAVVGFAVGILLTLGALQLFQPSRTPTPISASANPSRADVSISVTQKYLAGQLQSAARSVGLPTQATITLLAPDVVQVIAPFDFNALGRTISMNANARMRLNVEKGRVVLIVESVDVGNLNIPKALVDTNIEKVRATVEQEINRYLQRGLQGTSLRLINVRITSDDLTADFKNQ